MQLFFPVCLFVLDCLGVFRGKHKLWEHLRTHTQEGVVACPACGGMFLNNTKFFNHAKRQVSEDSKWLYSFLFIRYFHLRCFVISWTRNFINISGFCISQVHENMVCSRKTVVFIKHRSFLDSACLMN